jgi:hypothetical protein
MGWHMDTTLNDEHIKIIGLEFTMNDVNGTNQELAMFVPSGGGLVIPRSHGGYYYRPLITFHTTDGDHQIGRNEPYPRW